MFIIFVKTDPQWYYEDALPGVGVVWAVGGGGGGGGGHSALDSSPDCQTDILGSHWAPASLPAVTAVSGLASAPCPDSTLSSTCRLYRQHHGTSAACFSSQHTPRHRHQSTLTTQQNAGIGCFKVHSGNILKHSSRHLPGQSQVKSGKVEKSKDYWKEKEIYVSL